MFTAFVGLQVCPLNCGGTKLHPYFENGVISFWGWWKTPVRKGITKRNYTVWVVFGVKMFRLVKCAYAGAEKRGILQPGHKQI